MLAHPKIVMSTFRQGTLQGRIFRQRYRRAPDDARVVALVAYIKTIKTIVADCGNISLPFFALYTFSDLATPRKKNNVSLELGARFFDIHPKFLFLVPTEAAIVQLDVVECYNDRPQIRRVDVGKWGSAARLRLHIHIHRIGDGRFCNTGVGFKYRLHAAARLSEGTIR